jgi:outer membrane immunogenic protein
MRRIALALLSTTLLAGIAAAADLRAPARGPAFSPPPPSYFSWTGFYIGVHGGGDWFQKDWSSPATPINLGGCIVLGCNNSVGGHTANSWLAGGQVGLNYQVSNWVFGVEGQFSATKLEGSNAQPPFSTGFIITNHTKTDSLGTVAARVGVAWDRVLLYAKGGGAWAHDQFWTSIPGLPVGQSRTETRGGWMTGLGIEYAFLGNWSVKLEYDHLDFGTRRETLLSVAPGVGPFEYDVRQRIDLVKVGLNYRFGGGGPVYANY